MAIKILREDSNEETTKLVINNEDWVIPDREVEKVLDQLIKWKQEYWVKDC